MKKTIVILAVLLLAVPALFAGNNDLKKETKEIKSDLAGITDARVTVKKLDHLIDLWHDACLKSEMSLIKQNEVLINALLEENIREGSKLIEQAEKEAHLAKEKAAGKNQSLASKAEKHGDLLDDRADLKEFRNLLLAKKHIYQSMRRSESFSNRYRLLGDYAEILRREVDLTKVELAEDLQERREP